MVRAPRPDLERCALQRCAMPGLFSWRISSGECPPTPARLTAPPSAQFAVEGALRSWRPTSQASVHVSCRHPSRRTAREVAPRPWADIRTMRWTAKLRRLPASGFGCDDPATSSVGRSLRVTLLEEQTRSTDEKERERKSARERSYKKNSQHKKVKEGSSSRKKRERGSLRGSGRVRDRSVIKIEGLAEIEIDRMFIQEGTKLLPGH